MEVKLSWSSKENLLMIDPKKKEDLWMGDAILKKNKKSMVLNTTNEKRTICKNEVVALGNNIHEETIMLKKNQKVKPKKLI